jgi:hypothetical protein
LSSKKARRREQKQKKRDAQAGKRNPALVFTMVIAVAIILLVAGAMIFGNRSDGPGAPPWPGAVWSPEHGHWH